MSDELSFDSFEDALAAGLTLFNQQRYEEAYAAWESRWLDEAGDGADLLQGLLQVAVGFAKLGDGNPRAAVKLLTKGAQRMRPFAPTSFELDLEGLLSSVTAWCRFAEAAQQGGALAEAPPPPQIRTATQ